MKRAKSKVAEVRDTYNAACKQFNLGFALGLSLGIILSVVAGATSSALSWYDISGNWLTLITELAILSLMAVVVFGAIWLVIGILLRKHLHVELDESSIAQGDYNAYVELVHQATLRVRKNPSRRPNRIGGGDSDEETGQGLPRNER